MTQILIYLDIRLVLKSFNVSGYLVELFAFNNRDVWCLVDNTGKYDTDICGQGGVQRNSITESAQGSMACSPYS